MPKPSSRSAANRALTSAFNLGGEQAEADGLLQEAFYESGQYRVISSRSDNKCFLIGRTGSGKSAALQRLEEKYRDHVIRINPEDLSLPYITDLGAVKYLSALNVHMDPLFIALWKHVLLIEIIKHRYKVDSPEAKQRFLAALREAIKRDKSKQAALDYLEEFEGRFWCETDERVKEITQKFENQIKAEAGGKLPASLGGISASFGDTHSTSLQDRAELVHRFQRVVNETQLPRLNKMMKVLDDDILDSPQHYTYIVIDDLDRDWADEKVANDLIRCLFRAVVDLKRVQNLKVLVALRTNIFETLDFGRTGGQEEKFRALTLRVRWTRGDLEGLLNQRARVAATKHGRPQISNVMDLLPPTNKTRGNALDFILRRTLMRPRDAIAFLNQGLELASEKSRLTWDIIHEAETAYSSNRLLALRDEWKPTFPGIERVLRTFARSPVILDWTTATKIFENCIILTADRDFEGTQWMTTLGEPVWNSHDDDDPSEIYQPIIGMLYDIGFLGYSSEAKNEPTYSHNDPGFAEKASNIRKVNAFYVHPAFRYALDIRHDRE